MKEVTKMADLLKCPICGKDHRKYMVAGRCLVQAAVTRKWQPTRFIEMSYYMKRRFKS